MMMLESSALREWIDFARGVQTKFKGDVYLIVHHGGIVPSDFKPPPSFMFYVVPLDRSARVRFNYPSDFHPFIDSGGAGLAKGEDYVEG